MPSKKTIKRRIKSVSTTKHIMKAMDMVAASKLQKNKVKLNVSRPLFQEAQRIIDTLRTCENAMDNVFIKPRPVKNITYVVITSDRGLCGSYNTNVSQIALQHMTETGGNQQIIAFGSKGRDYFRRRGKKILDTFPNLSEAKFYENAVKIATTLVSMYSKEEVDEVYVVFTYFESALTYIPKVTKVLPIGFEDSKPEFRADSMQYEAGVDHFLQYAIPGFLSAFIYDAMLESASCEQASRMVSMESATKNAGEIIDDLTLTYNRIRQAHITQEINEIVSGANVLK